MLDEGVAVQYNSEPMARLVRISRTVAASSRETWKQRQTGSSRVSRQTLVVGAELFDAGHEIIRVWSVGRWQSRFDDRGRRACRNG